ncbi:CHAT domain-containing protein [Streptomyces sp. DH10]|uniref:CHAT domain-containing protein n=1 Tax=Streptomyces sp. DH10 TaxID=3040121 RepID=UPI00244306B5|nr:CHAT domain-containing protein [Streptomyces sp. DH10]MDG9710473.1 CHAT domain-containing protein [Streptomyces sp. DH10]
MELHNLATRFFELRAQYWQAADTGQPTGPLFQQLTILGRAILGTLERSGGAAQGLVKASDIAGLLLDAYGRELTTHQYRVRTYQQVKELWAEAEKVTPHATPEQLRNFLAGRAQYELQEGRASEALALVDRATNVPHGPSQAPHGTPPPPYGDLRVLRAEALLRLYDAETALEELAPLERDLAAVLPNGPIDESNPEAMRPLAAQLARGGAGRATAARQLQASTVYFRLLDVKAGALRDTGRPDAAEQAYLMGMPLYTASGLPEAGLLQLARCALDRGAAAEACRRLDLAAPLFDNTHAGDQSSMRAHLRLVRGAAYCRMRAEAARLSKAEGWWDQALHWCDRGARCTADHPDHALAAGLHAERARTHHARNDRAGAARAYHEMALALDRVLRVPLGHRFDTLHLRYRLPLLEEALVFAQETGDARLCIVITDLLKARAFSAHLSLARSDVPSAPDVLADTTEQDGRNGPDHGAFADLTERIEDAERPGSPREADRMYVERAELLTRIRATDPRWHLIRDDPPFDPDRLTRFLAAYGTTAPGSNPGRCVALSLYERPDGILAQLARPDGRLDTGIRRLGGKALGALEAHQRELREAGGRLDFWGHHRIGLADLIPPAFADEIADSGTCLLSPHGRLHTLPWTVVRHDDRHVIRGTAIGIVPNLSCVPLLDHRPDGPVRATLLGVTRQPNGEQLPEAQQAVRRLSGFLGAQRLREDPITGRHATVATLRGLLNSGPPDRSRTDVLQIITHGLPAPGAPFGAGVQMTDGILETGDVLLSRMCFQEVLLTACSTGLRATVDRTGGHGALPGPTPLTPRPLELAGDTANALVHAFHEAGAAFVLASPFPMWSRLATHHSVEWIVHRCHGRAPLEAARRAAVALLGEDDSPEQTDKWAGITAYGAR